MIRTLKAWKQRRRQARRERKLADPNGYPPDMSRDAVEVMIAVREFSMTSPDRMHGLCEAVRYIAENQIAGDVVECGVWRGGSMMAVAEMLTRLDDTGRELHLYDTFEGMSEPTDKDVSTDGSTARQLLDAEDRNDGRSVWCVASLGDVQSHMAMTDYPATQIHYHVGKVEDTIPANVPDQISLLRLDTDWYESTKHEMEHLFPRLVDGGVLIIDDYGHWEGARRAVDEYFQEHGIGMMLNRLDYTGRIGIKHAAIKRGQSGGQLRDAA